MDAKPSIDTELLRALAEGDVRRAGHLLVTQHTDEVFSICRAMVRNSADAQDIAQEVFSRAFLALPNFRGEASTRTWILRIARNRCVDFLRARQRQPWGPGVEADPEQTPQVEPSVADLLEQRRDLEHAFDALAEGERALVVLRFGHGLGYPEIAEAFGLKPGAVRMRLSRAVAKMREAVEARAEAPASVDEVLFSPDAEELEASADGLRAELAEDDAPLGGRAAPSPKRRRSAVPGKPPAPRAPAPRAPDPAAPSSPGAPPPIPSSPAPGAPPPMGAPPAPAARPSPPPLPQAPAAFGAPPAPAAPPASLSFGSPAPGGLPGGADLGGDTPRSAGGMRDLDDGSLDELSVLPAPFLVEPPPGLMGRLHAMLQAL